MLNINFAHCPAVILLFFDVNLNYKIYLLKSLVLALNSQDADIFQKIWLVLKIYRVKVKVGEENVSFYRKIEFKAIIFLIII